MPESTKPSVAIPEGPPPEELLVEDLETGHGFEAMDGSSVSVHYVGVSWSNGNEFDSSWSRGRPLIFELGAGRVISGWDKGVAGMRVGGRRRLTIPPHLAYGKKGVPGLIRADETLVFVVDLLKVD